MPTESHYSLESSKKGPVTLKYKHKYLHSKYDPIKEGIKLASSLPIEGKKNIIIFGLALGYHITPLLDRDQMINVIVIESSVEVPGCLKKCHRLSLLKDVKLFFGDLSQLNNWFFQNIEEEYSDSILLFDYIPSLGIDPDYYKKAKTIVNDVFKYKLQSYLTTLGFGRRWHENCLKNLKLYSRFSVLDNKSTLPVFLVGSGPSLDDQIMKLPELSNRGIVIALAPGYHRLVEEGVRVHFLVSTDGGIANRIHLSQNGPRDEATILISTLSVTPRILRLWDGNILIMNLELPLEDYLLDDIPGIPMQGNVALAAFWIAQRISSGPIYLLGMDFAFTRGAYHFKGNRMEDILTFSGDKVRPYDTRFYDIISRFKRVAVPGHNGTEIKTNLAMQSYLSWLEEAISETSQSVYTLSHLGARINGVEYRSLDGLLQNLPSVEKDWDSHTLIKSLSKEAHKRLTIKLNDLLNHYLQMEENLEKELMNDKSSLEELIHEMSDSKIRDIVKLSLSRMLRKSQLKTLSADDYEDIKMSLQRTQRLIQSNL